MRASLFRDSAILSTLRQKLYTRRAEAISQWTADETGVETNTAGASSMTNLLKVSRFDQLMTIQPLDAKTLRKGNHRCSKGSPADLEMDGFYRNNSR
jgi:hypothetical protein